MNEEEEEEGERGVQGHQRLALEEERGSKGSKMWGKGVSYPHTRLMGASRFRKHCSCREETNG
ncbi:hypothetical protein EYF80_029203 [Liparis tanakae]|uniref:Uncharacterized protein n=1 Tax=Liparis tanakae TaxID=230148 RepID=A0A4Z2H703_9TELE|nr:hypothetical protein EYF80_029203 [Liparis tanakae]